MSLFKAKEWWSSGGAFEELLGGSLKLAQLGAEGSGHFIVFAPLSPEGLIQVFKPQGAYRPADAVLEHIAPAPILQIECGKFTPGTVAEHIAILHPRSLAVYSLSTTEGHAEYGDQNILLQQYEHRLPRSAYNFIVGPFGGVKNKDFTCVQSLDGVLTFYEQDVISFSCFLPDVLIPGEIAFSSCADIFINCTSNWIIEAYSYYSLSHISDAEKGATAKKLLPNWTYNVGENIISIQTIQMTNTSCCFIMLGEKNLYCLRDTGVLQFMKKFDFEPVCFHPYLVGWYYENNARLMIMVISDMSTLYIYEQTTLLWSCQLTFMPLFITRGFFSSLPGSLVFLTDIGEIKCCYLGTEPELFTAPPLPNSEIDFEKAQEELDRLQIIIDNQNSISETNLINAATEKELPFDVLINNNLELNDYFSNDELDQFGTEIPKLLKCQVNVKLKPMDKKNIESIQVTFVTRHPLTSSNESELITDINDEVLVENYIYLSESLPVSCLSLCVVVLFINASGSVRVLQKECQLPFKLVCYPVRPLKEFKYKITIGINEEAFDLITLFKDFDIEELTNLGSSNNVIAFSSVGNDNNVVTIIAAKSSQRYRLQCNSITTLRIVLEEFINRLKIHGVKKTQSTKEEKCLKIDLGEMSSEIPKSFSKIIEHHALLRQKLLQTENELEILSGQFILIQKKLMMKYRERAPTLCEGIGFLLRDTHNNINKATLEIRETNKEIRRCGCELSCAVELVLTLFQIAGVNATELENVRCAISYKNLQDDNQNWEENVARNIIHLLHSILIKNEKERDKIISFNYEDSFIDFDVKRFIKYMNMIVENIKSKMGVLNESNDFVPDDDVSVILDNKNELTIGVLKVPEGSLYGHRKPILTARFERQQKID